MVCKISIAKKTFLLCKLLLHERVRTNVREKALEGATVAGDANDQSHDGMVGCHGEVGRETGEYFKQ